MDSQINPNLSLWRRIFAFSIDLALLECLSLILGWFFGDAFASWGRWGNLMGFGLAVLYFGVFNSHWGNGQTPGKQMTKIKAIAKNGKMLPLSHSLIRASILGAMLLPFSKIFWRPPLSLIIDFCTGTAIAITLYFILFHLKTRQGFHDLIVGSYVVRNKRKAILELPTLSRKYLRIALGIAMSISLILTLTFYRTYLLFPSLLSPDNRLAIQQEVQAKNEEVRSIYFNVYSYSLNQNPQTKVLQIKIDLEQKSSDLSVLRKNVTDIVFRRYPHITDFDTIGLTTYYGYTIGLAMRYQKQNYRYCPIAGKLELDRQFERHLFLKTLGFFELDWNLESSRPVFIKFPFFTYGSEPNNFSSVARTAKSLGNCPVKKQ